MLPDIDNIPDTGAVFTLGKSRFADNIASHFFIRKDPVVNITCGDEHSAVVCLLKPEKVTHVACGRAHTLICTGEQKIFACGSDQESQLGRGGQSVGDSSSTPVAIYDCGLDGPKILQISAGSHHSLALTSDGSVFAWGSNLEGQLGLVGTSGLVNKPTKLNLPEPIKQISAGYYHSAFLTESGVVYVCGEAESGKLGISVDFRTQVAPKQMQLSVPAVVITCGGHHTLVLGDDGEIYCTGSNVSGQLGMGTGVTEITSPKQLPRGPLENEIIKKLVSGESHIAVVTESGKLFTCGDGRHGKLGLEENENNVHELTFASKYEELFVTNVACGGCHTILVGRRRNDEPEDELSKQVKILPPLKVPAPRIQNDDPLSVKSEDISEEVEKGENEPSEKVETTEVSLEAINDIQKPESPKKLQEYESSVPLLVNESEESIKNGTEETESSEAIEASGTVEVTEIISQSVERPESSKSSVSEALNEAEKNDKVIEEIMVVEKPASPPLPVPPPKPPRQKNGSTGSNASSNIPSAPSSRDGSAQLSNGKETQDLEEESPLETNLIENNENEAEADKSAGSEKSLSNKSKTDTAETMPLETNIQNNIIDEIENVKDSVVQEIEEKMDLAADDSDVVQSPAPKIGKISKFFKTKRQETENGQKTESSPNLKSKSKTCNIL